MSDKKLTPELLLGAYASGIFPMAESRHDSAVYWVDPRRRGVLPLDRFHVSRSLAKRMRRGDVRGTLDVAFPEILDGCANRSETWINDTIRGLTLDLFDMGYAHGFGVWQDGELVGGLYGLRLGAAFFGESMFSRSPDGSKMAMAFAVDHLLRSGFRLFDMQFLTPHLRRMGGAEITRSAYRRLLSDALSFEDIDVAATTFDSDPQRVVQRITQTS